MATTTMVHVRVDENVKLQASEALSSMGLSMSDAIRVFLTRVASEKQLPFALRAPNAETLQAMSEADALTRSYHARFQNADELLDDLEKNSRQ
ncbi:type II toxin-antitoxin system RelB/DinJ family antitoxin [Chromatiaceae bacterium AAb-1]|nr:type II toxin-antitoxin system RelB/DinJ family antitoxin [Chromatiaceae bacterium AAb-1]